MTSSQTVCPACGGEQLRFQQKLQFKNKFDAALYKCLACTHRFLQTDDNSQAKLEAGYDHDYAGFVHDPFFAARVREALQQDIRPIMEPPRRILDVGCGNGVFMEAAQEAGYSPRGIDISTSAVDRSRKLGLEAEAGDFLTHDFGESFDIISLWDVMEHLRYPAEFLCRAKLLLNTGGIVLLKIPGFSGFSFSAIRFVPHFSRTVLGAPGHIQYFNRRSCEALLSRVGMVPIWFQSRPFRGRPKSTSLKRTVSRMAAKAVATLSGDAALFLAARVSPDCDRSG